MDNHYNQWLCGKPTEDELKRQRELALAYSGKPLFRGGYTGSYRGQFSQAARQATPEQDRK